MTATARQSSDAIAPDTTGQNFFRGSVDEFCVFDRALSMGEITELAGRDP